MMSNFLKCSLAIFTFMVLHGCQDKNHVPETISLNSNWQFKAENTANWLPATVPGNVFSDLLQHNKIPDPFIGNHEEDVQWVSQTNWEYKTHFKVTPETLKRKHIVLNFEGLDTYASVFLNDSLILKTNNAFREFSVDVKPFLKTENDLQILFENTSKHEADAKSKLHYTLPEGNRIFTRKAQFQYGWDWGPKLNVSGIWRDVNLETWDDFKIEDIYVEQKVLNDSIARCILNVSVSSEDKSHVTYDIYVNDTLNTSYSKQDKSDIIFNIKNPKRWWPHNLGKPYLYDVKVVVKDGEAILDSVSRKVGLRTIDLVTEKDSLGESFYFKVNGIPVYAKGANYIPQHSFQNQVTNKHYEQLLHDVVEANMNMLRVWGGGIYENDVFYDLCDEKGILVWQDFMFACAMYPGDDTFLENVQQEAIDNVKRLRNHPSVALWCGNNESSEGWHRWGWQADRSEAEKSEIWENYLKVFDSILPKTVRQYSNVDYWESSPKYGRGNPNYEFEGDAHDWWIWHDGYPFEHLETHVPRFMSEFGFQSFPSYEVINYINQNDTLNITSKAFKNHQKHSRGFQIIDAYMQRDFPVPDNVEDYVYVSQLLQAYGITKGIEAQRRARPYNMGTLYWQLNDCWPAVSWSSIDFFGNWKALHYKAKRSFENVLISSKLEGDDLNLFVVNDNYKSLSGVFSVKIMDFYGVKIWESASVIDVPENSSNLIYEIPLKNKNIAFNDVVVVTEFKDYKSYFYLEKPKDLNLVKETIQKKILKVDEGFEIVLQSKTLQKDVFLFCNEKGRFSDNYFDLLPNEEKRIVFKTQSASLSNLKIKTLNQL